MTGGRRATEARAKEDGPRGASIPLKHPSEVFGDFSGEEEFYGDELNAPRSGRS